VAQPLDETQFRDKAQHKAAVHEQRFATLAALPDVGLLWPAVVAHMRTWLSSAGKSSSDADDADDDNDDKQ
jgi:hypothetical protein